MPALTVTIDCEDEDRSTWRDRLNAKREQGKLITAMGEDSRAIHIGGLPHGMESGKTSICLMLELPDGTLLLTETSLQLFLTAARILAAAYPHG